ncbi:hypothetical protein BC828DRAFT_390881 [Blastocladiella britannica]|nr:hypothetical protein BC828DRAFT_390881 [Blastocladiella britannica]
MQPSQSGKPIREQYQVHGVDAYYESAGATYRNPHEPALRRAFNSMLTQWSAAADVEDNSGSSPLRVLDLACGSGEATLFTTEWAARQSPPRATHFVAADPYTGDAYRERNGGAECRTWSFADISSGVLDDEDLHFDLTIISFALHLIEPSKAYGVLAALAPRSRYLMVLSPTKGVREKHLASPPGWEFDFTYAGEGGRGQDKVLGWIFHSTELY